MNKITGQQTVADLSYRNLTDDCWLDKQDILIRLHISSRTLQRWRTKRIIPFTRIGRKIYYKESDLKKLLDSRRNM